MAITSGRKRKSSSIPGRSAAPSATNATTTSETAVATTVIATPRNTARARMRERTCLISSFRLLERGLIPRSSR